MLKKIFAKEINDFQEYIFFKSNGEARSLEEIVFVTMKVIFKDGNGKSDSRFAKAKKYYNEHYKRDRALRGKIPVNSSQVDNDKLEKDVLPAVKKFIINHRKFKPNGKQRVQNLKETLKDTNKITVSDFIDYLEAYRERHPDEKFLSDVKLDDEQTANQDAVRKINKEKIKKRSDNLSSKPRSTMDDKFIDRIDKDFDLIEEYKFTELEKEYKDNLKLIINNVANNDVESLLKKPELTAIELKPHYKRLKHLLKVADSVKIESEKSINSCKEILNQAKNKLLELDTIKGAYARLRTGIAEGIENDVKKLQSGKKLNLNVYNNCQIRKLEAHIITLIAACAPNLKSVKHTMTDLIEDKAFENNEKIAEVLAEVKNQALNLIIKLDGYLPKKKFDLLNKKIKNLFDDAVNSLNENNTRR